MRLLKKKKNEIKVASLSETIVKLCSDLAEMVTTPSSTKSSNAGTPQSIVGGGGSVTSSPSASESNPLSMQDTELATLCSALTVLASVASNHTVAWHLLDCSLFQQLPKILTVFCTFFEGEQASSDETPPTVQVLFYCYYLLFYRYTVYVIIYPPSTKQ